MIAESWNLVSVANCLRPYQRLEIQLEYCMFSAADCSACVWCKAEDKDANTDALWPKLVWLCQLASIEMQYIIIIVKLSCMFFADWVKQDKKAEIIQVRDDRSETETVNWCMK
jgi:hypothetical protein